MDTFALKPTIYFGENALSVLERLSGKRVLVVTDAFLAASSMMEQVREHLRGCTVSVFDRVVPDPHLELVAHGVQTMREFQPEVILAFGGGSPMDCAKAIRWSGGGSAKLWAVPTTAGTGSEMTSFAVLTDEEKGVKYPLVDETLIPDVAVLDPSLLAGVPAQVTADTGIDVIAHAVEAYVAVGATAFSDALAEKAFVLAWKNLPGAYRSKGESEEKGTMLYASCLAGMAFQSAGLGICHSLSHALGGRLHMPHGRLNGICLPKVIMYNAANPAAARRYSKLAALCGLAPNPRALAGGLGRMLTALNMPKTLAVDEPSAIAAAALEDRCTAANPVTPTAGDLEKILRELGR